jgi:hypothetical protein
MANDEHASDEDSYDSDEPPPLQPNLDGLKSCISQCLGRRLLSVGKLTRGRYHEIYALYSPDRQWNCIACLSRFPESTWKLSSEVATMKFLRIHTRIPVPEIYCYDSYL